MDGLTLLRQARPAGLRISVDGGTLGDAGGRSQAGGPDERAGAGEELALQLALWLADVAAEAAVAARAAEPDATGVGRAPEPPSPPKRVR
ncbi:MAG: hypothetical protein ACP5VP_05980 [Candidatus Limnocylindrales bacterium]